MPVNKQGLVIILRGLPGVGKSYIAKEYLSEIINSFEEPAGSPKILSTDDYFIKDGKFNLDLDKIAEAHKWNFERFKNAIKEGTKLIIVDNSNIKNHHYYHYLDHAQMNNYLVIISIIPSNDKTLKELASSNIHGLSQGSIRKMRSNFEWELKEK